MAGKRQTVKKQLSAAKKKAQGTGVVMSPSEMADLLNMGNAKAVDGWKKKGK